jgi:hypothetical protein
MNMQHRLRQRFQVKVRLLLRPLLSRHYVAWDIDPRMQGAAESTAQGSSPSLNPHLPQRHP